MDKTRAAAYETNLENELNASHKLCEANGRKLLIVGIFTENDNPTPGIGGITRVVSDGVTRRDANVFIAGLEREIARIKALLT